MPAGNMKPSDLRRKLLQERGIAQVKPKKRTHSKLLPNHRISINGKDKTAKMLYLEMKYGKPIEEQLIAGSLSSVVATYGGELDPSTVSRWIKRFKLRYSKDNLPTCTDCKHIHPCCQYPSYLCNQLVKLGLYDLTPHKRKELQGCEA